MKRVKENSIILISCDDSPGLIAFVCETLRKNDHNIVSLSEHVDLDYKKFFMRIEFVGEPKESLVPEIRNKLPKGANVWYHGRRTSNIVVLATKESHCLGDLLCQTMSGDIDAKICGVISNHEVLRDLTERFSVPFEFVPHDNLSREQHEEQIIGKLTALKPDFIVLAKYMRILSDKFVQRFSNKILNIHHSFLPAFAGAKPYQQAHTRGVKIIGATAHFVNEELDDGPIIVQNIIHVDHSNTVADMIRKGREVERTTLCQALNLILDERVFINGRKTVVFS